MNYAKDEISEAWRIIEQYRHATIKAHVTHVSRSGMSRRIRFEAATLYDDKPDIDDITWLIARCAGYAMNDQGLRVDGCGMDMRFSVISNFNYCAASHDIALKGSNLSWNSPEGKALLGLKPDARIYDDYFFDANRL